MLDPAFMFEGKWLGEDLKCPVCGEQLEIKIPAKIKDLTARSNGTANMRPVVSVNISPGEFRGKIDHQCEKVQNA